MKKRSQIRKYTVQKVSQIIQTQTHPQMLKMYAEHVSQKKQKLNLKKQQLLNNLNKIRKNSEKTAYQMVDSVKDRLDKKQKIIMDSNSRPTPDDIKTVSELFSYMQNQTNLISINSQDLLQLNAKLDEMMQKVQEPLCDYTKLDDQFAKLQKKCEQQEQRRDKLLEVRDQKRAFYKQIKSTIEEYRIKWQKVEQQIRERERQLDHLVTYFKVRQQEDQSKVTKQKNLTIVLEDELLKAQQILNYNSEKNTMLMAQRINVQQRNRTHPL